MAKLDLNVLSKLEPTQNYQVIEFKGEMDKSNNQEVRDALTKFIESYNDPILVFDLKYFDFINSEGVGLLVSLFYKMKKLEKTLLIVGPQPRVNDVFSIIGLSKIVPVSDTIEVALANL
jgi:anti-anti-sigma factor